jgi:hypothetical protein
MSCPRTGHGHDVLTRKHLACPVVCGTSTFGCELLDVASWEVNRRIARFTDTTMDGISIIHVASDGGCSSFSPEKSFVPSAMSRNRDTSHWGNTFPVETSGSRLLARVSLLKGRGMFPCRADADT